MKRSEINGIIRRAEAFMDECGFRLPPFARWTPEEWARKGAEADELRRNQIGWDVSDFGGGDFNNMGLVLFCLRNGNYSDPANRKPYAEKIMVIEENQLTPMHFHRSKTEDIINRAGGELVMKVYNSTPDAGLDDTEVTVSIDGVKKSFAAGSEIVLRPGESVTVPTLLYHSFHAMEGSGRVLAGEVSAVNDDFTDNIFLEKTGRFPGIEEDEPPYRLLLTEYPAPA